MQTTANTIITVHGIASNDRLNNGLGPMFIADLAPNKSIRRPASCVVNSSKRADCTVPPQEVVCKAESRAPTCVVSLAYGRLLLLNLGGPRMR